MDYTLIAHYDDGDERIVDHAQHDYLAWRAAGGIPIIEAAGRFLSVVDNQLVVNPQKASILAAEQAARAAEAARLAARDQAISDNLPSWATVQAAVTNIANLADTKAYLLKLSRVIYWLAKGQAD
jgi:hypothetical protein